MGELHDRLLRCFSSVFPNLTPDQLRLASVQNVPEWDSLAALTLLAVLQEEFAVQIDFGDLPSLDSFDSVRRYLDSVTASVNGQK
jgi:acyl carrier protein